MSGAVARAADGSRTVLLAAAGLHMVTQSALAPFYPELFREAYGVRELSATGSFLMFCQLAAVAALPLWGRATRHVPLTRLVTAGQGVAVLLAASLAFAPSYGVFTVLSVALVAAKAVVLLAYPALARSHPRGLRPGVVQYVAVLHAAAIGATLLGTAVVSVPDPRTALPLLAVAETVLLAACVAVLRLQARRPAPAPATAASVTVAAATEAAATEAAAAGVRAGRARLLGLAAFVLVNAVAVNAVRPYFTEYARSGGSTTGTSALLFLLPHLAVLAVLAVFVLWWTPGAVPGARRAGGRGLLPLALGCAAVGLAWQAATVETVPLVLARLLFGVGLGLGQIALDERVLSATGPGPAYSAVAAAQTGGLLLAPMLATATVSAALSAPLLAGAALFAGLAVLSTVTALPAPPPSPAQPGLPTPPAGSLPGRALAPRPGALTTGVDP